MTTLPYLYTFNMFHRVLRDDKSMPDVGSSKSTSLEPPIRAIATESFRLEPSERFLARVC